MMSAPRSFLGLMVAVLLPLVFFTSGKASATVMYQFTGTCSTNCDLHGTLATPISGVSSTLVLSGFSTADLPRAWTSPDISSWTLSLTGYGSIDVPSVFPFVLTDSAVAGVAGPASGSASFTDFHLRNGSGTAFGAQWDWHSIVSTPTEPLSLQWEDRTSIRPNDGIGVANMLAGAAWVVRDVPGPAPLSLFGLGLLGLAGLSLVRRPAR